MGYLANAGVILLNVIFGLAIGLFLLRLLLQLVRANFYNPICQFFYKATNPVLMPLRKLLPTVRGVDTAALTVAFLLAVIEVWLLQAMLGRLLNLPASLVLGLAALIGILLTIYFWLLLIGIVISLLGAGSEHPAVPLLHRLTEPLLRPVRRALPAVGPFDFSPLVVFLAIVLARVLIVAPLEDFGRWLAWGA